MRSKQTSMFLMDLKYALSLMKRNKLVLSGFIIVIFFIFLAIFGDFIVDPNIARSVDFNNALKPPSWRYLFGTDDNGRDVYSMVILAARYDLEIALTVIGVSVVIGIALGSISGYFGGVIDEFVMRVTDIFLAFPALILAMAISTVLGRTFTNLMLALIVVWWSSYARIMRGQFVSERERPYVSAAKILNISNWRIMFIHILPNAIYPMFVILTMDLGNVILTAAALSFIGLGPGPFTPEWGSLASAGARYMTQSPWIIFFPGIAILFACLGFNLVGDGLRDILDPRLRR